MGLFGLLRAYGLSHQRRNGPCNNFLDRFQMAPRTCGFCFDLHVKLILGAQKLCVSGPIQTRQKLLYSQGSKWVRQQSSKLWLMESFLKSPWSSADCGTTHNLCPLEDKATRCIAHVREIAQSCSEKSQTASFFVSFINSFLSCSGDKTGTLCMTRKNSLSIKLFPSPSNILICSTLFGARSPRAM